MGMSAVEGRMDGLTEAVSLKLPAQLSGSCTRESAHQLFSALKSFGKKTLLILYVLGVSRALWVVSFLKLRKIQEMLPLGIESSLTAIWVETHVNEVEWKG